MVGWLVEFELFIHSATAVVPPPIAVVLNLGLIELQGFGELVSGDRRQEILSNKSKKNKIHDTHFIFPTNEGFDECMYGTYGVQYLHQG